MMRVIVLASLKDNFSTWSYRDIVFIIVLRILRASLKFGIFKFGLEMASRFTVEIWHLAAV